MFTQLLPVALAVNLCCRDVCTPDAISSAFYGCSKALSFHFLPTSCCSTDLLSTPMRTQKSQEVRVGRQHATSCCDKLRSLHASRKSTTKTTARKLLAQQRRERRHALRATRRKSVRGHQSTRRSEKCWPKLVHFLFTST